MGTTFTTIQIRSPQPADPEQLREKLSKYMEKKGLIPTTEEKAQFSYRLAFSGDGSWATLSSPELGVDPDSINSEAQGLATAMKTCCIATSVFDSDFLFLYLYNAPTEQEDIVAIGDPDEVSEMLGMDYTAVRGKPECWNPFLAEGKTWEQLSGVWNSSHVFAEDALSETALLLQGMDSMNIVADYQYWEEVEPENPSLLNLYFETAQPVFIEGEPTKLALHIVSHMVSGVANTILFYNTGGISKGLSIAILGDCFKDNEVEIKEISVERPKNPGARRMDLIEYETFVAHPVKKQFADGRHGLFFDLDDFIFPEGTTPIEGIKGLIKGIDAVFSHSIILRFAATILTGSQHDFSVYFIPQSNPEKGQVGCVVPLKKTSE